VAGAAVLGRLTWQLGEVVGLTRETSTVATLELSVTGWTGHRPGQHIDLRLTAEDGYQAQRSYSIASAPQHGHLSLTVERLEDGEVSPYLVGEVQVGDKVELRGPIGGYFVWDDLASSQPLLLVAGGSGIAPLMSMVRYRAKVASNTPVTLLYSSRSFDDVIYRDELARRGAGEGLSVHHTLTRSRPPGWTGFARRIDRKMLEEVAWPAEESPVAFVCGPTSFVETAAEILVGLGYKPESVRTERFGATGG
jgi:ferredoxin-NADP reductase